MKKISISLLPMAVFATILLLIFSGVGLISISFIVLISPIIASLLTVGIFYLPTFIKLFKEEWIIESAKNL